MQPHPGDLDILLIGSRRPIFGPGDRPLLGVFLKIMEQLEPGLVWSDIHSRLRWLVTAEEIRHVIARDDGNTVVTRKKLEKAAEFAADSWRGPASADIEALPFIRVDKLRAIAERDLASMRRARRQEELKAVVVFAGCVIEAILLDVLLGHPRWQTAAKRVHEKRKDRRAWKYFKSEQRKTWKLAHFIGVCGPHGLKVLSARTEKVADTLRDWRNYVHPEKERAAEPLTLEIATIAEALASVVVQEVRGAVIQTGI